MLFRFWQVTGQLADIGPSGGRYRVSGKPYVLSRWAKTDAALNTGEDPGCLLTSGRGRLCDCSKNPAGGSTRSRIMRICMGPIIAGRPGTNIGHLADDPGPDACAG
jgi:hypothetical protein